MPHRQIKQKVLTVAQTEKKRIKQVSFFLCRVFSGSEQIIAHVLTNSPGQSMRIIRKRVWKCLIKMAVLVPPPLLSPFLPYPWVVCENTKSCLNFNFSHVEDFPFPGFTPLFCKWNRKTKSLKHVWADEKTCKLNKKNKRKRV